MDDDIAEIFYESFCPETKSLWQQYSKENDPYKKVLILDKMVQINLKSSLEAYDKIKREQGVNK
jgi:hypothetical protein